MCDDCKCAFLVQRYDPRRDDWEMVDHLMDPSDVDWSTATPYGYARRIMDTWGDKLKGTGWDTGRWRVLVWDNGTDMLDVFRPDAATEADLDQPLPWEKPIGRVKVYSDPTPTDDGIHYGHIVADDNDSVTVLLDNGELVDRPMDDVTMIPEGG